MAFSWLRFWKRARRSPLRIRMYTRQGCRLCEEAWKQLQEAQAEWGFSLEAVDIDVDPELVKLHSEWVPVVTVDGKVRFRGKINALLLQRLLKAETHRS